MGQPRGTPKQAHGNLDGAVIQAKPEGALTHSKMDDYDSAVADCRKSTELDPNYSRAYLRLGHLYMHQKKYALAKTTYEQALARDLDNGEIRNTLEAIERHLSATTPGASEGPPRENVDFRSILSNPSFMRMASTVMANPTFRSMADNMISQMSGEPPPTPSTAEPTTSASPGAMFTHFQAMADQMQRRDPQLLETLRSEMTSSTSGRSPAEDRGKQEKDQDSPN